jgi:hypothetical protein
MSDTIDSLRSASEIGNMVYTILTAEGDELIELVNSYIAEGWQPLGGIATSSESPGFSQAMIRYRQIDR